MKLYGKPPTRVVRVMWVLDEMGLEYESVPISLLKGDQNEPEFRALNPAGRVPVLVDGGLVLTESVAIALYLVEKYPHQGFLPQDPAERAVMRRWLFFVVTEIEAPLERIGRHTMLYPIEKRSPAEVAILREEIRDMLTILEDHMRGRQFLLGEQACVADFIVAYTLDWAHEEHLLEGFTSLLDYRQRMYDRPAAPESAAS